MSFQNTAFGLKILRFTERYVGGVTTIQVLPGSGNVIGGRAVTLKLKKRLETRSMRFPGAPFGLKMACGENPKRIYGEQKRQPMSRMGNIALLRRAFIQAEAYAHALKKFERDRMQEMRAQIDQGRHTAWPDLESGKTRNLECPTLKSAPRLLNN